MIGIHRTLWAAMMITTFFCGALLKGYSDVSKQQMFISLLENQPLIVLTNINIGDASN